MQGERPFRCEREPFGLVASDGGDTDLDGLPTPYPDELEERRSSLTLDVWSVRRRDGLLEPLVLLIGRTG